MRIVKILGVLLLVYVGLVAAFESTLGYFQPRGQGTLVITTVDAHGVAKDRVIARLQTGGHLYVAANHWPRAWYHQVLEHPDVQVTVDGKKGAYRAVPVSGAEQESVNAEHRAGIVFRILTGFPPRRFVRLDPVAAAPSPVAPAPTPAPIPSP